MNFFKIHKRPLISNDIKAQKDDIQDHYKEADKKPKNEAAIIKSIILSKIESALEQVNIERDRLNEKKHFSNKNDSVLMDRISWNIGREQILIEFREYVKSMPDSLYRIQRKGSQILEINGLDGSSFELYHLKEIIGGSIYQLKDNHSNQTVDIIEYNYLEKLEKTSENGYLFPDDNMIKALDQLR
ncbi:hypothetical protein [Streptococcus suis]|uniref:hypothetical protein n=1 Tax=Streptococcus suis TaxID=1307 RepID=UPI0030103882